MSQVENYESTVGIRWRGIERKGALHISLD